MTPLKLPSALALFLCCVSTGSAQRIDITVTGIAAPRAALSMISGEKVALLDSVTASSPGRFTYAMRDVFLPGFYRLSFDARQWVDFVYDREDVVIETSAANIRDSLNVIGSEANRLFNEYVRLSRDFKTKAELLALVLSRYPADDPYHATTMSTLKELQGEYFAFIGRASRSTPRSFIARYIRSAQLPMVDPGSSPGDQLAYVKAHALDSIDFADEDLVRSDLFTSKAIEYLTYHRNPQLPKDLLEKEFMTAVDSILVRAKVNEPVYAHVTEYLLDGFRKFGFEACIDYILEHYVVKDDLCLDGAAGTAIGTMVEQKKLFVPGTALPAIALPDSSGRTVDLKGLPGERFLLVFYSAGCPHCRTMIPKLKEVYGARTTNSTEVIGVSLDATREEWLGFVREVRPPWPSVSDLRGWKSPLVDGYRIYATPTMVLVDSEMRMIAAPRTVEDAKEWFSR